MPDAKARDLFSLTPELCESDDFKGLNMLKIIVSGNHDGLAKTFLFVDFLVHKFSIGRSLVAFHCI